MTSRCHCVIVSRLCGTRLSSSRCVVLHYRPSNTDGDDDDDDDDNDQTPDR